MARGNGERARSGPRGVPALQVPDGPWCASTWPVVDIAGDRRRAATLAARNRGYDVVGIRDGFKAHIAATLKLAGIAEPDAKAQRIFDLETKLAGVHYSLADSEDPSKGNNHWARADLDAKAPGIDWAQFLTAAGLSKQKAFVVWQPNAFAGEAALVKATPIETWKEYLTFHYIDRNSGVLPKAFVEERFNFYGKTLSGTPAMQDRWKRAIAAVNASLGEAVGKLYVEKYFTPATKAAADQLVKNLLVAMGQRLDGLTWMSAETKAKAKAKLATYNPKIGGEK